MKYMEELMESYGRKAFEISEAIMAEEDSAYAEGEIKKAQAALMVKPGPLPLAVLDWEDLVEMFGERRAVQLYTEIVQNDAEYADCAGGNQ